MNFPLDTTTIVVAGSHTTESKTTARVRRQEGRIHGNDTRFQLETNNWRKRHTTKPFQ